MNKAIVLLLLVMTMLFWAINFYVVKIAMDYYSPVGVATWRFLFGALSLCPVLFVQYRKSPKKFNFTGKDWLYMAITSFLGIFLTIYFFNLGLKTTTAVNGSLIIATSPTITGVFSYFLLKKQLVPYQWLAILISFFGVALILAKGELATIVQLDFALGDVYILCMAVVFSLSQIVVNKFLQHIDAIVMTTITSIMALFLFALFSSPELLAVNLPTSVEFWSSIFFMGILGTGVAYSAFYFSVVKVGATTATLYMNLIPFFTVLLSYPFGEPLYVVQLIGGLIIILGLILYGVSSKKLSKKKLPSPF